MTTDEQIAELTRQRDQARDWAVQLENRVGAARAVVDGEPEVVRWIDGQRLIDRDRVAAALADPS